MAILNPCCCITLRAGAKIVAVVDILVALTVLLIFVSDLTYNIDEKYGKKQALAEPRIAAPAESDDGSCEDSIAAERVAPPANTAYVTTGVWTILTVFLATNIGISALLYTGARNYSIRRCKWWFYIQAVITSVSLIVLILILCFQVSFALVVFDLLIHVVYRMYTLWVVYLFIGELTYLDTLCHLNSNKKGPSGVPLGGGILYPASMYTNGSSMGSTSPTSYDYYGNTNIYANTPYQTQHYNDDMTAARSGHITATIGGTNSPIHHYNSSDDGLPPAPPPPPPPPPPLNKSHDRGIDNPSYLP